MPLPSPSPITRASLRARLTSALGVSASAAAFWSPDELNLYLAEALRTWNAAAAFWRARGVFQTAANTPFYDLSVQVPLLLANTLTDQDSITAMEYSLLEPPTPTAWTGTSMFSLEDLTRALQRRRDQFLGETGIVLSQYAPSAPPTPVGRVALDDAYLDVRRAAWKTLAGAYNVLWREDEANFNAYMPGWNVNPDAPLAYSMIATPTWQMQLAPIPADKGTLDLLAVLAGEELDPATGVLLGVPDDFEWVVKFGALADLLSFDGPARDPFRAQYCEARWKEGVQLARIWSTVIHAEIQGQTVPVVSVFDLDADGAGWMNTTGQPSMVGMAGANILAAATMPNGVYSVTVDVVRKAIVPTVDAAPIELSYDIADVILGYAEHLAAFLKEVKKFAIRATNREFNNRA